MRFEDFSVMAEGLDGLEGPVVLPDGSLLVVQVNLGLVTRVFPDGSKRDIAHVGEGPSGLAIGPDGKCYIVNSGQTVGAPWPPGALERAFPRVNMPRASQPGWTHGKVQRLDIETGKFETLYESYDGGKRLLSPNDLVFDADGGLWFTDYGRDSPTGRDYGGIFYCKPDGSHIERMDVSFVSPNGIGIAPDGATLYMTDSFLSRLWAFDIVAPGKIGPPPPLMPARVVQTLGGYQILDSLKVEEGGSVCTGTLVKAGINVFHMDGTTEHVAFPGNILLTNLCFGGRDMRDIYAVSGDTGRIYKGRWPRAGLKLNFNPY